MTQTREGPSTIDDVNVKGGSAHNRNLEKCILCNQPHSGPGKPGTPRSVRDLATVFETGLDARLPEKVYQYGQFWCCTTCEPMYQILETECAIFIRARNKFNEIRSMVARIVVDSVKTSDYLDNNNNDGNAFDSTRAQIFMSWSNGLKQRDKVDKQKKTTKGNTSQNQTPQPTQNSTQEAELDESTTKNTFNATASATSEQPEPIVDQLTKKLQQHNIETLTEQVAVSKHEQLRIAKPNLAPIQAPNVTSQKQYESNTCTARTTAPKQPVTVVQQQAPKAPVPSTSTSSSKRIVSNIRNSGPIHSALSLPNLNVARQPVSAHNRNLHTSQVNADVCDEVDVDADENSFEPPIIIAVESLSTKTGTMSFAGDNQTSDRESSDIPQTSPPTQTQEEDEPQSQPLRTSISLAELNKNHAAGSEYTSNKIDATAATFAARAFVPTPAATAPAPAPAAAPPAQNTSANLVRTRTGSSVRIVYTPGKAGSVRIKRHPETQAITDLFTADENYLDAVIDDSEKGVLTITPKNGGPAKTFRYTPKAKKKSDASSAIRRCLSTGDIGKIGENPKSPSPSPPQLERMDVNVDPANGAAPTQRISKSVPPPPPQTSSGLGSSSSDPRTSHSTTAEITKPPTLTHTDVRHDAGEPNAQVRTSGRSGRAIKRPYEDSQWVSEVEIDKIIGDDADVAKHSRPKASKKGDETKERGSGAGTSLRARRASLRQTTPGLEETKQAGESMQVQVNEPGTGLENSQETA